jgi:hypothetical protein
MQNIVDAFAIRAESVPFWWREGLAHWYARGVDPRLVEVADPNAEETSGTWDWAAKASARARQGLLPGQDDLLTWHDERACGFADHVALWAFVDYLLAQGDASFQRFALQVRQRPLRTRYCPATLALAWHDEAFRVAYGADRQALDARWRKSLQQARR